MFNVVNWEINRLRTPRTKDMVDRLAVITARDVELTNHPIRNPTTIFNPGLLVTGDEVRIYASGLLYLCKRCCGVLHAFGGAAEQAPRQVQG
ncbi:MAG: hypothetical protein GXN98_02650 [Euryarchaeota archaeon]|nr:hypothetical protein [Euryarchaeota archaeon]